MAKQIIYIWEHEDWPAFRWDDSRIIKPLSECRLVQGKFLSRVSSLGISLNAEARAEILTVEARTTSEIEGEKIDMISLRSSVYGRLKLAHAGLPRDKRIEGLLDMLIDATGKYNVPLTDSRLRGWHSSLFPSGFSGLSEISVGQYRKGPIKVVSGRAGNEKIHFEGPPGAFLKSEMKSFFLWWNKSMESVEGIIRAAIAHLYFVTIHPFEDGNGRIARALTDMALAQDDKQSTRYYSLSRQILDERKEYYTALERAQKGNCDITEWLIWFLGCFTRSIIGSEEILANSFLRAEFAKKPEFLSLSERQRSVLLRVLESGFEGGLTTRKYMAMAKVSRATAFRELDEMLYSGLLRRSGKGRSSGYTILL